MQVTIYGVSDDLVEVEGDLREEFQIYRAGQLLFSDGTELQIEYTSEVIWRITYEKPLPFCKMISHFATDGTKDEYSDRLVIEGDFRWVECWPEKGPTSEAIYKWFEDNDPKDWEASTDKLLQVYRLAAGHVT